MKKQLMTVSAVALLALTVGGGVANAAVAGVYNSDTKIKFKTDTSVNPPVDPLDPNNEVLPKTPDGTDPAPGTAGPLSIDFASSFSFDEQFITTKDMDYSAKAQALSDGTTRPNYVQVTDKRGGASGWNLQVKQEKQLTSTQTNSPLTGAYMTLNNGEALTTTGSDALTPTILNNSVKLSIDSNGDGETQNLLNAAAGQGAGTWVYRFGTDATKDSSVSLHVPGVITKYAEEYSANLVWTLSDVPTP